ncbi:MAG: S1-like domain-containing RNA-binding protein [bacterium]
MIEVGQYSKFKVIRKSDLGYMLGLDEEEVLLHFRQANRELEVDEIVEAFVYYDSEMRIAATLDKPFITIETSDYVEVVEVKKGFGVFVNNNLPKDMLLSKDYLSDDSKQWPQIGDKVLVRLKLKQNRLNAKLLNKQEILEKFPEMTDYAVKEVVSATIVRATPKAYNALTDTGTYIFIPIKQTRELLRLGQQVEVTIISRHDDEYVGTTNPFKEDLIDTDVQTIISYLEKNERLPLTAKSQSEEIAKYFTMSRKAFKRALGNLYKEKRVYFDEINTYLSEEESE